MALVNDSKKYIFFHLYKCGGLSIRNMLSGREFQKGHSLPLDYKILFPKRFNEYFKFTIIRNPFDFLLSTYFYSKAYTNHFMHDEIVSKNMDMEMFIPYYMETMNMNSNLPIGANKVVTFKQWLLEGDTMLVDYVGKLETIEKDFSEIAQRIGLDTYKIPVININPHRTKDYRPYYNENSKKMVEKYFAWELEKYEYKF